jgi:hypothetical protein
MPTTKLLLLELNNTAPEDRKAADVRSFAVLPFTIVPQNAPQTTNVIQEFTNFPSDQINLLLGIDNILRDSIDVLSLSLGFDGMTFDPNHPMQIATHIVHEMGIPVVVAAGNAGPALGTMQTLAHAPWVIAVGATDKDGSLMDSSSRGTPGGAEPSVVADGSLPVYDPRFPDPSTSFATPKVAAGVAWIAKSLNLLINDLSDEENDQWTFLSHAIRMPIIGIPDTGVNPGAFNSEFSPLAKSIFNAGKDSIRISRTDQERLWFNRLMQTLRDHNVTIEVASDPDTVKRALELSARPVKNRKREEVGAGFVSSDGILDFFKSFVPSRFIQCLCPSVAHELPAGIIDGLDRTLGPLWKPEKCIALGDHFGGGIRVSAAKVI